MTNTNTGDANGAAMTKPQPRPHEVVGAAMVLGTDEFRGALEPSVLNDALVLAEMMASIRYCGVESAPDALGRIMTGRSMGLAAMQSLRGLYTVNGRQGIDAGLMHALCLKSPLCEYFDVVSEESNATKATCVAKRRGRPEQKFVFTIEQAERAGLLTRETKEKTEASNWTKWREDMLVARCRAITARRVFPDLIFGMYSKEELEDVTFEDDATQTPDPREMEVEIVPSTVQAAKRNFAGEADALIAKTKAVTSRAALAEVRADIEKWDGPDDQKARIVKTYNDVKATIRKPVDASPSPAADASAPLPAGNLFAQEPPKS